VKALAACLCGRTPTVLRAERGLATVVDRVRSVLRGEAHRSTCRAKLARCCSILLEPVSLVMRRAGRQLARNALGGAAHLDWLLGLPPGPMQSAEKFIVTERTDFTLLGAGPLRRFGGAECPKTSSVPPAGAHKAEMRALSR
jgi:hypothetical protein